MAQKSHLLVLGLVCALVCGQASSATPPWATLVANAVLMQFAGKGDAPEKNLDKKAKEIKAVKLTDEVRARLLPLAESFLQHQQSATAVLNNIKKPINDRFKVVMEAVVANKRDALIKENEAFINEKLPGVIASQTGLFNGLVAVATNLIGNLHGLLVADGYQIDTRMPPQLKLSENSITMGILKGDWDEELIKRFTKLVQEYNELNEKVAAAFGKGKVTDKDAEAAVQLNARRAVLIDLEKKIQPTNVRISTVIRVEMELNPPKTEGKDDVEGDEGSRQPLLKSIRVVELDKAGFPDLE